jgi:hypothetical protein
MERPEIPAMTKPLVSASDEHRFLIDVCLQQLVYFFWQGPGLLLISGKGIAKVLCDLADRGVHVVGLEGFELDGGEVHPRLDLIFDADRLPGFPTPLEAIETWPDEVWVDVTLADIPATRCR